MLQGRRLARKIHDGFTKRGAFKSVASSKTLSGIVIDPGLSQRDGQRRHKLIQLAGQRPALLQDLIVGRRAEATQ